ncbi:GxxExxY protein [Prosthecobacter fusiformis]|uniref:GxxExxY protein n=1 Tax=Prosthecobacter fusiformis TaxID=48464 RepID=A0A4R7S7I0_9BACT|nr:GxxExxY protein [Prosthecobacter fusiformis]TDU73177.1 GxxExxY protein [Prosthecobacter fusiformis]
MDAQDLPHIVIRACLQVHETLGTGLTRDAYEECLAIELREMEIPYMRAQPLNFNYRGHQITAAATMDFVIEKALVVRVLACDSVTDHDRRSMETWLKLSGLKTGLIVNFQVPVLRKGIHRISLKRRDAGE